MSLTPRLDRLESGKNLIINGNFDFWQRSISMVLTASQYVSDRFRTFHNGTFVSLITNARSTDVPSVAQSGFASTYSYSMTKPGGVLGGGAADYIFISHNIEGYNYDIIHGAKNFRVQFWVKSSVVGTYSVSLNNSATDRVMVRDYSIPVANTWQKVVMDFVSDSTGTWNLLNGVGLQVGFVLAVGSNNNFAPSTSWASASSKFGSTNQTNWAGQSNTTFNIAQVQVIPGDFTASSDTDVPFQRAGKTIQDELDMCRRYYQKSFALGTTPANGPGANSFATLTGIYTCCISRAGPWNAVEGFPQTIGSPCILNVPMRTAPSVTAFGTNVGNWFAFANVDGTSYNAPSFHGITENQFTPGQTAVISVNTAQAIQGGHWTADAEL